MHSSRNTFIPSIHTTIDPLDRESPYRLSTGNLAKRAELEKAIDAEFFREDFEHIRIQQEIRLRALQTMQRLRRNAQDTLIANILKRRDQEMVGKNPLIAPLPSAVKDEEETFSDRWMYVDNTPLTLDEWQQYFVAGFPYLWESVVHSLVEPLQTIAGFTRHEHYSYPNIVERVQYAINLIQHDDGNEITGVYVYFHKKAFNALKERLQSEAPHIKNTEDLDTVFGELERLSELINHIKTTPNKEL